VETTEADKEAIETKDAITGAKDAIVAGEEEVVREEEESVETRDSSVEEESPLARTKEAIAPETSSRPWMNACLVEEKALFVEGGGSVIASPEREPGAALALGTPDTIPSCGRRDRRAG
jgi:hypothetical protein